MQKQPTFAVPPVRGATDILYSMNNRFWPRLEIPTKRSFINLKTKSHTDPFVRHKVSDQSCWVRNLHLSQDNIGRSCNSCRDVWMWLEKCSFEPADRTATVGKSQVFSINLKNRKKKQSGSIWSSFQRGSGLTIATITCCWEKSGHDGRAEERSAFS